MPVLLNTMDLPDSSAPTLQLVQATEPEIIESSTLGSISWGGPLDKSDYLRREAHLRNQPLTRDGGITYWILVDTAAPPTARGSRRILASCETIRKRALIALLGVAIRETICHGIGSVHCNQDYRGRGFGRRMMMELANQLDTWQQKEGERADFSVLWSDIGKVRELTLFTFPLPEIDGLTGLLRQIGLEDILFETYCLAPQVNS